MSATRTPTPAQLAAYSTIGRNLLVNAGAGSGKTWVLVERFVHLLAHPDESGITSVSQIVAVTFTTKAAQEMRARVRDRLNGLLASAESDSERDRWARHLKDLDAARISTIHALAGALLRANAADLDGDLDPAFVILDEVESGLLAQTALEEALRDTPPDDPALALFAAFSSDAVSEAVQDGLFRALPPAPDDVLARWAQAQAALWAQLRPGLVARLRAMLDFALPASPPPDDRRVMAWQEAQAAVAELEDGARGWGALQRIMAINLQGGSRKAWGDEAFAESSERLKALRVCAEGGYAWLGSPVETTPGGCDAQSAGLAACWRALIERARAQYAALKAARSALDFDDLERLALALLDRPGVAARYDGAEFRHVMVDEFQDTSETQWAIIQRLASPARPGALFLVGDPKQSIYGFRGADARVFDRAHHAIRAQGGEVIPLARSFRTHQALVTQFNALFRALLVRDFASPAAAFQTAFGDADVMDAERATSDAGPALEILLAGKSGAVDSDDSGRAREAQAIAARIQALKAVGREYGELALLLRSTTSMPEYEAALKEAGIPYVTVAGRGYYGRQEVWDVLALLRAVYQPDDALSLATALRSPLFALSDDALLALRWPGEDGLPPGLWDALGQAASGVCPGFPAVEIEAAAFAHRTLTTLRESAGRVPLADLIEQALAATGYRAVVSALPDGARRRGNLDKLVSKAVESSSLSLGAFLQRLGDLTERETREGEAAVDVTGAVQLMTIHAAKGLEFPVVFVADAGKRPGGKSPVFLLDEMVGLAAYIPGGNRSPQGFAWRLASRMLEARDDAETRRLLYVAATRARDLLIISSAAARKQNGELGAFSGLMGLLGSVPGFSDLFAGLEDDPRDGTWCDGSVRCAYIEQPRLRGSEQPLAQWADAQVRAQHPPALLAPVTFDRWAAARSLSATAVAELGKARLAGDGQQAAIRQRWRGHILRDAPTPIGPITASPVHGWSRRRLGEAVHQALHGYRPGMSRADLRVMLESLLWEDGVLPDGPGSALLEQALALTLSVLGSPLQREIAAARVVYRELPFAWQTEKRAIYGVVDVLFQRPAGGWALADYKTAFVADTSDEGLRRHAKQYHFQLAVYAAAVRDVLALPDLRVYIHYIQHQYTLEIRPHELDVALQQLEREIGQMMVEDAPA